MLAEKKVLRPLCIESISAFHSLLLFSSLALTHRKCTRWNALWKELEYRMQMQLCRFTHSRIIKVSSRIPVKKKIRAYVCKNFLYANHFEQFTEDTSISTITWNSACLLLVKCFLLVFFFFFFFFFFLMRSR